MNNLDAIKDWWDQASSRDQLAIIALGTCVFIYLMYAVIYKPVTGMREKQVSMNESQVEALERVRDLAAQWNGRKKDNTGRGESLVQVVENSTRKHKLLVSNMQPGGNTSVRIRFESVVFNSFIAWANEMETQQRLQMKDLSVAPAKGAGMVSVNLRLQRD